MTRFAQAVRRRDDGAVAIIVALMAIVLFGMGAMAVDLGNAWSRKRSTQTDADLSALAGASLLPASTSAQQALACARAKIYLDLNLPPSDATDVNPLAWSCTFPDSTHIQVITPSRTVAFGLANAIGFSDAKVRATATATVVSPDLGLLPFIVDAGSTASDTVCLKANTSGTGNGGGNSAPAAATVNGNGNGNGGSGNGGGNGGGGSNQTAGCNNNATEGNFGFARFPRDDQYSQPAQWLVANTALGVQKGATPKLLDAACSYFYGPASAINCPAVSVGSTPAPSADIQCKGTVATDVTSGTTVTSTDALTEPSNPGPSKPLVNGETCVLPDPGFTMSALTDALVSWNNGSACSGRLAKNQSSQTSTFIFQSAISTCYVAPDKWPAYDANATLPASILDDPRFGIVPITTVAPAQGDLKTGYESFAIVTFYGVYLRNLYDNNGNYLCQGSANCTVTNKQIAAVDAALFPLSRLPSTVNGSPLDFFIGTGPVVPALSN